MRLTKLLTLLALTLAAAVPQSAWALISIDAGTYEVPALVVKTRNGPTAIFNLRTRSECRLVLKGEAASKLSLEGASGLRLKFKLDKKLISSHGEAELLESAPMGDDEKVPPRVGNNLKPVNR